MPSLSETLIHFSAVVITGGSSGIGKSFIELSGKVCPGLLICNLSRRKPDIPEVKLKLRHFPCDLGNSAAIEEAAKAVQDTLAREAPAGKILLVNNSGFGAYGEFPQPAVAEQLQMTDVNMRAVVHLTALLLPALKARGGAIITVASTAAFQPTPWCATYGASKAFVLHWSLALGEELRGTGVQALVVCPGPTGTDFFRRAGLSASLVPKALSQSADEVVRAALHALGAGRSLVISGWKNRVGAWSVSLLPKTWVARLARRFLGRFRLQRARP